MDLDRTRAVVGSSASACPGDGAGATIFRSWIGHDSALGRLGIRDWRMDRPSQQERRGASVTVLVPEDAGRRTPLPSDGTGTPRPSRNDTDRTTVPRRTAVLGADRSSRPRIPANAAEA